MYQFEYRLGPQQWAEFSSLARDRAWRADRNRRVLSRTADAKEDDETHESGMHEGVFELEGTLQAEQPKACDHPDERGIGGA